jgi:autotransporter-associated beta strand protein
MFPKTLMRASLAAAVLASAVTAQAGTPAPAITITNVGGWGGGLVWDAMAGWEFHANANVEVTAFGVWNLGLGGLASAYPVGLWNSSGQLLASTVVPAGTAATLVNDCRYVSISPVLLSAGQDYLVADYMTPSSTDPIFEGNSNNTISTSPNITWLGSLWMAQPTGLNGLTFPTVSPSSWVGNLGPNLLLVPAGSPPGFFYWKGPKNASWSTLASGQSTNWVNQSGSDTNALPGAANDVVLTASGAQNFTTTTLDGNFSINSLTFSAAGAATVAPGAIVTNTLTLGGGGLTVGAGAGAATISAPLVLGAAQTWTNSSPNLLTISGNVTNGGNSLTVAGAGNTTISGNIGGSGGLIVDASGTLTLSGASTYSGGTTVNGGALSISPGGSLAGGAVTVNPTGYLNVGGSLQATALSVGGLASVAAGASLTAANVTVSGTGQFAVLGAGSMTSLNLNSGTATLANGASAGLLTATGGNLYLANTPNALVTAATADFSGSLGTVSTNPATGGRLAVTSLLKLVGGTSLSYAGAGSFQVAGSNLSNNVDGLTLTGGTTTIHGSQPSTFQYYRFHPLAVASGNQVQMDEVGFFAGSNRILANNPVVYVDSNNNAISTWSDGAPQNCNDANLSTKFGSDTSNGYLVFSFNSPQSFGSYNWATGNDTYSGNPGRNPTQWEVDGSNNYGTLGKNAVWTQLSLVNTTYTPAGAYAANNTWQPGWALIAATPADVSMLATNVSATTASTLVLNGTGGTAYLGVLGAAANLSLAGNSPALSLAGITTTSSASVLDAAGNTTGLAIRSGGTVDVAAGQTLTIGAAVLDGTSATALVKTSPGTLVLAAANRYSGPTTVDAGSLIVNGSLAKTAVMVNGGASLVGTGSIGGSVTVAGGSGPSTWGTISLVDGTAGTLTLSDAISTDTVLTIGGSTAGSMSLLNFEVGATADRILIAAGKVVVNSGGGTINIMPLPGFGPGTYNLMDFASNQASGLGKLTLGTPTLPGYTLSLRSTPTAEQLVVSSVPEPSTLVLLAAGAAGSAVCVWRRRKTA